MKLFDSTMLSSVGASAIHALLKRGPIGDDASPTHYQCDCGQDEADIEDPWRRGYTRRKVMGMGAGLMAAPLATQLVTTRLAFAQTPGTAKNLVCVISFRGGCDGLNMVVPHGDAQYSDLRSRIGIPRGQLIKADGFFGLNPAFAPLGARWDAGQFAAVHAVAMDRKNKSHFDATREYEQASVTGGSGYLNRILAAKGLTGTASTAFQAAQISGETPFSFRGEAPTLTINRLEDFRLNASEPAAFSTAVSSMFSKGHPADQAVVNAFNALQTAAQITASNPQPGAEYPDGGFPAALREIATIHGADVGMEIAACELGGFDTHTNQGGIGGNFEEHLTYVAQSIAAFLDDLESKGKLASTTVITTSEFGRTVNDNGDSGTDHGHGNCMLVFGGGVNGGQYYANWPGLENSEDGDLEIGYSYKDILSELFMKRSGVADLSSVFPGYSYTERGVFNQM
jgi:uncharacterized protein (DUF1501 family)